MKIIKSVIVVCAGNICRSPIGEVVLRDRLDKAGLDINKGAENLVNVLNHKGPHPEAYHQLVFDRLTSATQGLKANTAAYKTAVTNTLQTIGKEAQTVGSTVNKLLTKNP